MFDILYSVISLFGISSILCDVNKKSEDRLLLSPVELIDLVRHEETKNRQPPVPENIPFDEFYDQEECKDQTDHEQEKECEDSNILKNRKVWSRWSKWSDCSVTCGGGTIARHRVCVAGRCAPNEREEQHRPCSRAPCLTPQYNITDEMHEFE